VTTPYSGYQQGKTYTAAADRAVISGGMQHGTNGVAADNGVILGGQGPGLYNDLQCVRATGMTVQVKAGKAMIGGYTVVVPAAVNVVHDPSTTAARRDLIIVRVWDLEAGDASDNTTVEIVKGTTTSDPPIPARSLIICQADIPASATAPNLTDRRNYVVAAGGTKPSYPSIASSDPLTATPGQLHYDMSNGRYYRRTASAWTEIIDNRFAPTTPTGLRIESRHVVISTGVNGEASVVYQQAFSATPVLHVNAATYGLPPLLAVPYEPQLWSNQFTVIIYRVDTGLAYPIAGMDLYYTAIGPA
jgi:hypothetical protein